MKILLAIDLGQPHASYRDALLAAGALPEEVEIVQPGENLPGEFDGLLLSGGADVDPSRYGEAPVNGSVQVDAGRDELDFELLSRAERLEAPVFGICRGLQVLNVAFGGTLWQDLPSQRPRGVEHSFPSREGHDRAHPAHEIRVSRSAPGTLPLAAALAAAGEVFVNSRHHQAVKDLAPGLVALAASPDDLVEAFAREAGPFLAAVQWHPENLVDRADQKALFAEFLDGARFRASRQANPRHPCTNPEPTANVHPGRPDGAPVRDDRHHETPFGNRDAGEPPSPPALDSDEKPEPA
jgi:putative glutamine amidotransferase